jgi:transposase
MEESTARGRAVQTIVERPAALDVDRARVTACARVPDGRGRRERHVAEFPTTVRGLLELRDWLAGDAVTRVVMEATGVVWKAPWAILEDEYECMLVNARHVEQVAGRKTDVSDAAWLCQLAEAGLLKANFVPPRPIRELRNLTRYRKTQIQARVRARSTGRTRRSKTPGSSSTPSRRTILGRSGRDMLDALVAGETDPKIARRAGAAADAQEDFPPRARRWPDTSTPITGSGSARSGARSTSSTSSSNSSQA